MDLNIKLNPGMIGIDFVADTNVLIYLMEGHPSTESLLPFSFAVSTITEMELLGKTGISSTEINAIESLLADCLIIELNGSIKSKAIKIKQLQKVKLPDAIIAATTIELKLPLVTADKKLDKIEGLNCLLLDIQN